MDGRVTEIRPSTERHAGAWVLLRLRVGGSRWVPAAAVSAGGSASDESSSERAVVGYSRAVVRRSPKLQPTGRHAVFPPTDVATFYRTAARMERAS
jgi:hypothetical protein